MAQGTVPLFRAKNTQLQVQNPTSLAYDEVPFSSDISTSGGEAATTDGETFREPWSIAATPGAKSLAMTIDSYARNLPVWKRIVSATGDLAFRLLSGHPQTYVADTAGLMAAIATTGVVTFSGTGNTDVTAGFAGSTYSRAVVIRIGTTNYTVVSIDSAGVVTVDQKPASAVSATACSLFLPAFSYDFRAQVTNVDQTITAGGLVGATVTLQLNAPLGEPGIEHLGIGATSTKYV